MRQEHANLTPQSQLYRAPRGIQPGQVAWSPSSQLLHRRTEEITTDLVSLWQKIYPRLEYRKKLTGEELMRLSGLDSDAGTLPVAGVAPDGGIVLYRSAARGLVPLFSVEAKEQQNAGNAVERWFKNHTALKVLGPRIAYVTFCSGEGARPNGVICKALNHAFLEHATNNRESRTRRWNRLYYSGPSMFRSPSGFKTNRVQIILERLMIQKIAEIERS